MAIDLGKNKIENSQITKVLKDTGAAEINTKTLA
jgi:hypothetical protein